jgi:O-antigen/teichoic acid export membrane protein
LAGIQARETVRYTVLIRYVWEPVGKMCLVSLALWAGWRLAGVLCMLVVVSGGTLALGLWAVRRVWRIGLHELGLDHTEGIRDLVSFCLPLSVGNLFGALASRTDLLVLGYWVPMEQVGQYQAAFQTSAVLALVLGAFDVAFAPMIGRTLARPDRAGLTELYQSACRLSAILTVPLGMLLIIFSEEILGLFGPAFAVGSTCLIVLVVGQILNSGVGEANTVLLMGGHSRIVMRNAVFFGIALIAALLLVAPIWGAAGTALAVAGTLGAVGLTRVCQVARLYGVWPPVKELCKPIGAGALTTAGVLLVKGWLPSAGYPILAAGTCAMYAAVLCWMELHPADRATIRDLLVRMRLVPA